MGELDYYIAVQLLVSSVPRHWTNHRNVQYDKFKFDDNYHCILWKKIQSESGSSAYITIYYMIYLYYYYSNLFY